MSSDNVLILFRAEGSSERGYGHLFRCAAISEAFDKKQTLLACSQLPSHLVSSLSNAFGEILEIRLQKDDPEEKQLQRCFKDKKVVVVQDGYDFGPEWRLSLREAGAAAIVMVDDLYLDCRFADAVINPSPEAGKEKYPMAAEEQRFYCGTPYAPVKSRFFSSQTRSVPDQLNQILIAMGGADPLKLGPAITAAFLQAGFKGRLILMGPHEYSPGGAEQVTRIPSWDAETYRELLLGSDAAVLPASTMSMEAMSTGIPLALGWFIDNQQSLYRGFMDLELAHDAGDLRNFGKQQAEILLNTWSDKGRSAAQLNNQHRQFDGNQHRRFREIIQQL